MLQPDAQAIRHWRLPKQKRIWERPSLASLVCPSPKRKELHVGFLRICHARIAEAGRAASLMGWVNRNLGVFNYRCFSGRASIRHALRQVQTKVAVGGTEKGEWQEKSLRPSASIDLGVAQQLLAAAKQDLVE